MIKDLDRLKTETIDSLHKLSNFDDVINYRNEIFGRKGKLSSILRCISEVSQDQKKLYGQKANDLKNEIELEFNNYLIKFQNIKKSDLILDISEPGVKFNEGHLHPISIELMEVENIFVAMGFSLYEGPELDNEYNNFDSLNIPFSHPARDMQDTFFIEGDNLVMRTHTSNTQNRLYKTFKPPFQVIIPGRCFRNEATDASHDLTFHQVEGVVVGENISLSHIKGVMKEFLSKLFKKDVLVRFRPGYFPFVEPGLELDFSCLLCDGKGCSVCKKTGWVEFMGCGMIHKNVLKEGGVDVTKYNGFAFGFGLTRLVMMRYGIEDIRHFHSGDLRFNYQF